jgi:prepilin-type N-terminal cleavage/methylation domain-containing protein
MSRALPRAKTSASSVEASRGFTLVEMLIVLVVVGLLFCVSITSVSGFRSSLEFRSAVDQVLSDIKFTQQTADSTHTSCRINFTAGKSDYSIVQSGNTIKSAKVGPKVTFYGKSYFSFAPSGNTDVGGSGTLAIRSGSKAKKIIVSSMGRVRAE